MCGVERQVRNAECAEAEQSHPVSRLGSGIGPGEEDQPSEAGSAWPGEKVIGDGVGGMGDHRGASGLDGRCGTTTVWGGVSFIG